MGTLSSDFLFTNPTFVVGMGSVLNLKGNFFPFSYSSGPDEADIRALYSDFGVTGEDLHTALKSYEQQVHANQAIEEGCVGEDS